jgi:peroxiredoxin
VIDPEGKIAAVYDKVDVKTHAAEILVSLKSEEG